jgi:hypothetical protein
MAAAQRLPSGLRRVVVGACVVLGLGAAALALLFLFAMSSQPVKAAALSDGEAAPATPRQVGDRLERPAAPASTPSVPEIRTDRNPRATASHALPTPPPEPQSVAPVTEPVAPVTERVAAPVAPVVPLVTPVVGSAPAVRADVAPPLPSATPSAAPSAVPPTTTSTQSDAKQAATPGASGRVDEAAVEPLLPTVATKTSDPTASKETVTRALTDSGRATNTTTGVVLASGTGEETATKPRDVSPVRDAVSHASIAAPVRTATPTEMPAVPSAPGTPSVPEAPSMPLTPAPGAPTSAPRSGSSTSSSNDAARSFQLLLYAVGTTMAALILTRRRYLFIPRVGAARIGFVPIIERPG